MSNNSYAIGHEQCPQCKRLGKDNSKDNLAIYSDGHKWCFSCGYHVPANKITSFMRKQEPILVDDKIVRLPPDVEPFATAPRIAKDWLSQYEITSNQIAHNNIMWSDLRKRLIFPYFINGNLIAWQGRWFGSGDAPKWYTDGKIDTHLYVIGPNKGHVILCEDIISAIKLSKISAASPIFGSVISSTRFRALKSITDTIYIWLDPDKQKEAIKFANIGRAFGLDCRVIISDKDPKEHNILEIQKFLDLN